MAKRMHRIAKNCEGKDKERQRKVRIITTKWQNYRKENNKTQMKSNKITNETLSKIKRKWQNKCKRKVEKLQK
jgi:hypothetical protein